MTSRLTFFSVTSFVSMFASMNLFISTNALAVLPTGFSIISSEMTGDCHPTTAAAMSNGDFIAIDAAQPSPIFDNTLSLPNDTQNKHCKVKIRMNVPAHYKLAIRGLSNEGTILEAGLMTAGATRLAKSAQAGFEAKWYFENTSSGLSVAPLSRKFRHQFSNVFTSPWHMVFDSAESLPALPYTTCQSTDQVVTFVVDLTSTLTSGPVLSQNWIRLGYVHVNPDIKMCKQILTELPVIKDEPSALSIGPVLPPIVLIPETLPGLIASGDPIMLKQLVASGDPIMLQDVLATAQPNMLKKLVLSGDPIMLKNTIASGDPIMVKNFLKSTSPVLLNQYVHSVQH